jgi:hypothetical protein
MITLPSHTSHALDNLWVYLEPLKIILKKEKGMQPWLKVIT